MLQLSGSLLQTMRLHAQAPNDQDEDDGSDADKNPAKAWR